MKGSKRLVTIAALAERGARDAAQALAATNHKLSQQEHNQDLLASTREEYLHHIERRLCDGSAGYHLKVLSQSVQNLQKGLDQVAHRISSASVERDARLADWTSKRARSEALDRLIERRRASEAQDERRRTERAIDDAIAGKRRRE